MPPPSSLISFQYVVQNMDDDLNNNIDLTWLESSRYPNQNRFKYPELQTEIPALQNDSGFQSRLRAELAMLKRKSALKVNPNQPMWHVDPNRSCGRCRAELGRIMNRGAFCQVCKVRVCKNCREYNIKGTDWICTVCHKNLEIQVASGEWVKEHMSHSGLIPIKKKNSRHYIPTAPVDLIKSNKNIKRSWTISNPSGTAGPQIQPRSQVDPRNPFHEDPRLPPPKIAPPLFLNIPPPPTTSPPPIPTGGHTRFMPNLHPPGVVTRRNVPLRSQSMSQADHQSRYHGPVPRRHHPLDRVELADIDSDIMEPRKYKTLEGPLRSGARAGQPAIITHPENGGFSTNSLERGMRRRLPDVPPSRSLPRPAKRGQSDSRSRERTGNQKRSQSYGDDLQDSKRNPRQLPGVPGSNGQESHFERHIIREPTPDYDASSIMDEPATTKVKANAIRDQERSQGCSPSTQNTAKNPKKPDLSVAIGSQVPAEIIKTTKKTTTSKSKVVTTSFGGGGGGSRSGPLDSLKDDEPHTNRDLSHKLVPDGNDFKLVFISSDSSKDSELNSSLEGGISSDQDKSKPSLSDSKILSGGEFIDDEMEWAGGYRSAKSKPDFMAASSPKQWKKSTAPPALPPKSAKLQMLLPEDYHFISSSSSGAMSDGDKLPASSSSPSTAHSILTAATRDRTSPLRQSPRIPKIHNIPISREAIHPSLGPASGTIHQIKRSQSAHSIIEATAESETSQDHEVQAILHRQAKGSGNPSPGKSKGANLVKKPKRRTKLDLHNTSAEVEHYMSAKGFASITHDDPQSLLDLVRGGPHPSQNHGGGGGSIRSFEDRSLGEMSIHDQLVLLSELEGDTDEDPKIEQFRSFLRAEIQAFNTAQGSTGGLMSRSLSESDLSELCGASVQAPSPDELLRSFSPSSEQSVPKSSVYALEISGQLPEATSLAPVAPKLPPKSKRFHGGELAPSSAHLSAHPAGLMMMKGSHATGGLRAPSGSLSSSRTSTASSSNGSAGSGCLNVNNRFQLPETFVDIDQWQAHHQNSIPNPSSGSGGQGREFKSEYCLNLNNTEGGVHRSASSITARSKPRAPVSKPVRRSKSHKATSVTNILHGGPVTFVSVNNINHLVDPISPTGSPDEAFQGSHTLPRAGRRDAKQVSSDESDVIITNHSRMEGGGQGVRIQIGSGGPPPRPARPHKDQRVQAQATVLAVEQESQTSLAFRSSEYDPVGGKSPKVSPPPSAPSKEKKGRRKYTLKELEVEGFEPSSCSESERHIISDEDDIDLSSLIEGAVDDDEFDNNEYPPEALNTSANMSGDALQQPSGAPRIQRVDDSVSSEDEDLSSMAAHQGSLSSSNFLALQIQHSDTEANFLESSTSKKPQQPPQPTRRRMLPKEPSTMVGDDDVAGDSQVPFASAREEVDRLYVVDTSDFDSLSTTSASYVVNHSDLDSIGNEGEPTSSQESVVTVSDVKSVATVVERQLSPVGGSGFTSPSASSSSKDMTEEQGHESTDDGREPSINTVAKAKSAIGLPMPSKRHLGMEGVAQGAALAPHSSLSPSSSANALHSTNKPQAVASENVERKESVSHSSQSLKKSQVKEPEAQEEGLPEDDILPTASSSQHNDLVGEREVVLDSEDQSNQRKGSVLDLIARFETKPRPEGPIATSTVDKSRSTRSATPDRHSRSLTPDQRPLSAGGNFTRAKSANPSLGGLTEVSEGQRLAEISEERPATPLEPEKEKQASDEALPLGAEAQTLSFDALPEAGEGELLDLDGDIDDEMAKTLRTRNGGYTSYVFISSDPAQDDASSVMSVGSNKSSGDNRVRVNIKETGANCVVLQDGRASNISIVSTESSELGSPTSPINGHEDEGDEDGHGLYMHQVPPPPELPAKIRSRHGVIDMSQHFSAPPGRDYNARTRGGEPTLGLPEDEPYFEDEDDQDESGEYAEERDEETPSPPQNGGLANYFTSSLEAAGHPSSRRGRPPVIRAADRAARTRQHPQVFGEDGMEGAVDGEEHAYVYEDGEPFRISEVHDGTNRYEDELYSDEYDVRYDDEEEFVEDAREYPMCQPVYDDSDYSESEHMSSGDEFFDREEELRGYNRQIDFTLHTILEESNEDSEADSQSVEQPPRKHQSDPSALERYFFYDVGGGNEDDTFSETSLNTTGERAHEEAEEEEEEPYYLSQNPGAFDDGGSVGSESDGQRSPNDLGKKRKVIRSKGARTDNRLSDRGESDNANSNVEEELNHRPLHTSYSNSSDENQAHLSSDSPHDTMKRKKKQPRRSFGDIDSLGVINPMFKMPENTSPKHNTPPITPLPSQIIEVQPVSIDSGRQVVSASPSGSEKELDLMKQKKFKSAQLVQASPSGSPPVNGPVRKHKSRDSGFVGSNDDLLRNDSTPMGGGVLVTSSDSNHSLSDHETERKNSQPRLLEKLSEVSENTEDDAESHLVDIAFGKGDLRTEQMATFQFQTGSGTKTENPLVRKDSFHNWSSDEDTNIMMNRMRAFFKGLLAGQHGVKPASEDKPAPIQAFEEQLTKLMRTVPGINEDQVKEIVEYLSSEDTWSDSYDSSDYTSSDLDGAYGFVDPEIPDLDMSPEIQEQIAASCREIMSKYNGKEHPTPFPPPSLSGEQEEFQKEAALMYQRLMAKMQQNQIEKELHKQVVKSHSPPIAAKVMQHISARLVALMHEVEANSDGGGNSSPPSLSEPNFVDRRQMGPPSRRYKKKVVHEEEDVGNLSMSKSVENVTKPEVVAREVSHSQSRRGSLGLVKSQLESLQSQSSSSINDDERCSWKGSFESTLAADLTSKHRKSASELTSSSIEQIDKTKVKSARGRGTLRVQETESDDENTSNASTMKHSRQSTVLVEPDNSASRTLPRDLNSSSSTSSSVRSSVSSRHSTNSLPRMGTSAIKKNKAPPVPPATAAIGPSQIMTTTVTLAAALSAGPHAAGPRSARYRPPGYRPAPQRKISPSVGYVLPQRKTSMEGMYTQRFNDDIASEMSSKSGSPSPVITRDFRESSVNSRSSLETNDGEIRDERYPSPFNKSGSLSSLGSRSESMMSVYSQEGGRYGSVVVRGDVEFGMLYSFSSGCLEMAIKQCRDLASVDTKRNRSDPYVKVYLLPDKTKGGKRKTKVKKHTLNPVFDEILKFQMPLSEVERRTMWLTVWHSDMFGRNDFLGEVMMPMAGQALDDPSPKWYSLQDRTEAPGGEDEAGAYRGEIIVALKFVPLPSDLKSKSSRHARKTRGKLMVLIKEAKNLVPLKGSTNIDPFCKCYLLPERNKSGKQKTSVCRRSLNPRWEHTVTWDQVSLAELADRSLEVSIWDHDRLGQNEMLGGVRFNLGSGKHQSKPSTWMDSAGKEVTLWQQMLDRTNFWVEGAVNLRPVEKMNSTPSPI